MHAHNSVHAAVLHHNNTQQQKAAAAAAAASAAAMQGVTAADLETQALAVRSLELQQQQAQLLDSSNTSHVGMADAWLPAGAAATTAVNHHSRRSSTGSDTHPRHMTALRQQQQQQQQQGRPIVPLDSSGPRSTASWAQSFLNSSLDIDAVSVEEIDVPTRSPQHNQVCFTLLSLLALLFS
jgi:hypothetical protein